MLTQGLPALRVGCALGYRQSPFGLPEMHRRQEMASKGPSQQRPARLQRFLGGALGYSQPSRGH
jgi:hypothetical protein